MKEKARLRREEPKLSNPQQKHRVEADNCGTHSPSELAKLFSFVSPTIYRTVQRQSALNTE